MKKWVALLLVLLLIPNIAYAIKSTEYHVGRDIAPGSYIVNLYKEDENALVGVAVCIVLRPVKETGKIKVIQTEDMKLNDNSPNCTLNLLDGDSLLISYSDDYNIRLINLTGTDIKDIYPGAINGVNLTKAISSTVAVVENNPDIFPGVKSVDIKYGDVLPSIELMLYMDNSEIDNYEAVVHDILYTLNIACQKQNGAIEESAPFYHGGIYDDVYVIIGVYDESIIYSDEALNTYYILPGTFTILEFD